jgi:hypothetical protein
MNYLLIAILIIVPKKVNGEEEAPQYGMIETSIHLRPAGAKDDLLLHGVYWDVVCGVCLE